MAQLTLIAHHSTIDSTTSAAVTANRIGWRVYSSPPPGMISDVPATGAPTISSTAASTSTAARTSTVRRSSRRVCGPARRGRSGKSGIVAAGAS